MVKRHTLLFMSLMSCVSFSLTAMEMEEVESDPLHGVKAVRQRRDGNREGRVVHTILTHEVENDVIDSQQASEIERGDFYGKQKSFYCANYCCLFGVTFVLGGALLIQKAYQYYMVEYSNEKTL